MVLLLLELKQILEITELSHRLLWIKSNYIETYTVLLRAKDTAGNRSPT